MAAGAGLTLVDERLNSDNFIKYPQERFRLGPALKEAVRQLGEQPLHRFARKTVSFEQAVFLTETASRAEIVAYAAERLGESIVCLQALELDRLALALPGRDRVLLAELRAAAASHQAALPVARSAIEADAAALSAALGWCLTGVRPGDIIAPAEDKDRPFVVERVRLYYGEGCRVSFEGPGILKNGGASIRPHYVEISNHPVLCHVWRAYDDEQRRREAEQCRAASLETPAEDACTGITPEAILIRFGCLDEASRRATARGIAGRIGELRELRSLLKRSVDVFADIPLWLDDVLCQELASSLFGLKRFVAKLLVLEESLTKLRARATSELAEAETFFNYLATGVLPQDVIAIPGSRRRVRIDHCLVSPEQGAITYSGPMVLKNGVIGRAAKNFAISNAFIKDAFADAATRSAEK